MFDICLCLFCYLVFTWFVFFVPQRVFFKKFKFVLRASFTTLLQKCHGPMFQGPGSQVPRSQVLVLRSQCQLVYLLSTSNGEKQKLLQKVFCKRNVLKVFAKFLGKHLCRSLFLNKIAGRRSQMFSCEFCKFFRALILENMCKRLLLSTAKSTS